MSKVNSRRERLNSAMAQITLPNNDFRYRLDHFTAWNFEDTGY